jgi:DNA-binding LacI/PurR family transcriptional regulator
MPLQSNEKSSLSPRRSRATPSAQKALNSVTIQKVDSPALQIADRIRSMIDLGELEPGMRLPSTRELSDQLNVDASSAHRALTKLVKEGRLVRTPYVGTFVAEPPSKKLERLGFYIHSYYGQLFNEFGRALLEQINLLAHKKGFTLEVFSDTRNNEAQQSSPPEELLRQARSRRIQGVISSSASPQLIKWLDRLPVPYATVSNPAFPHGFNWDREALTGTAIERPVARGCQRPAVLTTLYDTIFPGADAYQMGIYNGYKKAVESSGLAFNPRRIVGVSQGKEMYTPNKYAGFAFESFKRLWEDLPVEERPDGIFIYPDTVLPGVLLAATSRGLKIPEDIRLAVYTNEEVPIFCPYPIDRIQARVADTAKALVKHINNELKNRKTTNRNLPIRLIPEDAGLDNRHYDSIQA